MKSTTDVRQSALAELLPSLTRHEIEELIKGFEAEYVRLKVVEDYLARISLEVEADLAAAFGNMGDAQLYIEIDLDGA